MKKLSKLALLSGAISMMTISTFSCQKKIIKKPEELKIVEHFKKNKLQKNNYEIFKKTDLEKPIFLEKPQKIIKSTNSSKTNENNNLFDSSSQLITSFLNKNISKKTKSKFSKNTNNNFKNIAVRLGSIGALIGSAIGLIVYFENYNPNTKHRIKSSFWTALYKQFKKQFNINSDSDAEFKELLVQIFTHNQNTNYSIFNFGFDTLIQILKDLYNKKPNVFDQDQFQKYIDGYVPFSETKPESSQSKNLDSPYNILTLIFEIFRKDINGKFTESFLNYAFKLKNLKLSESILKINNMDEIFKKDYWKDQDEEVKKRKQEEAKNSWLGFIKDVGFDIFGGIVGGATYFFDFDNLTKNIIETIITDSDSQIKKYINIWKDASDSIRKGLLTLMKSKVNKEELKEKIDWIAQLATTTLDILTNKKISVWLKTLNQTSDVIKNIIKGHISPFGRSEITLSSTKKK
ncbi:hypothetical protein QLQ80_00890 [Mycoplasma sp. M5725]|uniref:Lipoprotein n=1 Tax=Mycoplasma phocimorsus TaxID=3045839 RepID=A0AAJ1PQT9_9MOLU|nr:hypothetical protein [Mycoplasma phocimorsus]MDJ1645647.1 hypothetical protein [Mycoplasma phocimorsus]